MLPVSTAWLGLSLTVALIVALSYATIRYYADAHISHPLSTLVVLLSLLLSLCFIMLVPLDVFVLSYAPEDAALVRQLYYAALGAMALLALACVPFAYFFAEDLVGGEDEEPCCARLLRSVKYTVLTLLIVLALVAAGLLLGPGTHATVASKEDLLRWVNNLIDVQQGAMGERALVLVSGALIVLGLLNAVLYTAFGLAALPIALIRGAALERPQRFKYDFDQMRIYHRKMEIQRNYSQHARLNREDLRELAELTRQEKLLRRQGADARYGGAAGLAGRDWAQCVFRALAPFRVILGVALLVVSALLFSSLALTSVDKAFNSPCGWRCGFVLDKTHVFNPVDHSLVFLSRHYPFDNVALALVALYFFVASVYGVVRIGIRLLGFQVYKIEKGATWPQGLLLFALIVMLIILALTVELLTLAPQYATFGAQTTAGPGGERVSCALLDGGGGGAGCAMSQIASIVAQININLPLLSAAFYFGNWAFIVIGVFGLMRESLLARKGEDDDDAEDDFELVRLLARP